jgi:hypothetical protein
VSEYFDRHLSARDGKVHRFDVPGINAINFLLEHSLGGGGIASLRPDPLGKSFGQMLLSFPINSMPCLQDIRESTYH